MLDKLRNDQTAIATANNNLIQQGVKGSKNEIQGTEYADIISIKVIHQTLIMLLFATPSVPFYVTPFPL